MKPYLVAFIACSIKGHVIPKPNGTGTCRRCGGYSVLNLDCPAEPAGEKKVIT